jgi:hypothetical protein
MIFDRFAARYRASLTTSAASASSPIMGSCRSPLSERKENKNRITLRENLVPHWPKPSTSEMIKRPASLRSDSWMLSFGSLDALRRNHCRVSSERTTDLPAAIFVKHGCKIASVAPYAASILRLYLTFVGCIAKGLIGPRASHYADLQYLF